MCVCVYTIYILGSSRGVMNKLLDSDLKGSEYWLLVDMPLNQSEIWYNFHFTNCCLADIFLDINLITEFFFVTIFK